MQDILSVLSALSETITGLPENSKHTIYSILSILSGNGGDISWRGETFDHLLYTGSYLSAYLSDRSESPLIKKGLSGIEDILTAMKSGNGGDHLFPRGV